MVDKDKILKGRKAVEGYRTAHAELHSKPWHKGIPAEHTPLLEKLVNALEGQGFGSAHTAFEPRKTEILAKFWDASNELNMKELGFKDRKDFEEQAKDSDREALDRKWR